MSSFPGFDFPLERRWVQADPRFVLRYQDDLNQIYEFVPGGPGVPLLKE